MILIVLYSWECCNFGLSAKEVNRRTAKRMTVKGMTVKGMTAKRLTARRFVTYNTVIKCTSDPAKDKTMRCIDFAAFTWDRLLIFDFDGVIENSTSSQLSKLIRVKEDRNKSESCILPKASSWYASSSLREEAFDHCPPIFKESMKMAKIHRFWSLLEGKKTEWIQRAHHSKRFWLSMLVHALKMRHLI